MKRVLALILATVLCLSLCACGGGSESDEKDERDIVVSAVRSRAVASMAVKYEITGSPNVTATYTRETSKDVWEVSGKITVKDKYGDQYTCTYDAVVEYDAEDESASVVSFEHTTPTKSR